MSATDLPTPPGDGDDDGNVGDPRGKKPIPPPPPPSPIEAERGGMKPIPTPPAVAPKVRRKPQGGIFAEDATSRPCSVCHKTFTTWRALFGHMRCHPERNWRGITPPISGKPGASAVAGTGDFVCPICRRTFKSPQALGGHRASHRSIKGCYAIGKEDSRNKNGGETDGGGKAAEVPEAIKEAERRGCDVDLNKPPPEDGDEVGESPPPPPTSEIDLNN